MKDLKEIPRIDEKVFRLYLQEEFLLRCKKNSQYSMRSFAKSLSINQSFLSKLMRGIQPFTQKTILRLCEALAINPLELAENAEASEDVKYNQISSDVFHLMSDWYHFAILELMKIEGFQSDSQWIAKKLCISVNESRLAIERLERLNFISIENGKWELVEPDNSWSDFRFSSAARKSLQMNLLEKAAQAVEEVPFAKRENSSLTIACDESLVPEIKEKINDFIDELDKFVQSRGSYNQVYQACVSFFPLTTKGEENEI